MCPCDARIPDMEPCRILPSRTTKSWVSSWLGGCVACPQCVDNTHAASVSSGSAAAVLLMHAAFVNDVGGHGVTVPHEHDSSSRRDSPGLHHEGSAHCAQHMHPALLPRTTAMRLGEVVAVWPGGQAVHCACGFNGASSRLSARTVKPGGTTAVCRDAMRAMVSTHVVCTAAAAWQ